MYLEVFGFSKTLIGLNKHPEMFTTAFLMDFVHHSMYRKKNDFGNVRLPKWHLFCVLFEKSEDGKI